VRRTPALRLAQVEAADHPHLSRVRLAHDVAEQIAARGKKRAGIVKGHARRIRRDDAPHVHQKRVHAEVGDRGDEQSGVDGRIRLAQVGLEETDRLAFPPGSIHGRAGEGCFAEPVGIVGPLAAITSSPATVQPRSVGREGRRTSISAD
jgi:hypothetical protein